AKRDSASRPSERQNESDNKNPCIRAVFAGHQHLLKSSLSCHCRISVQNKEILVVPLG
ncbi:Uncharacterized protein APZ42_016281, partial [Daphnia magna]